MLAITPPRLLAPSEGNALGDSETATDADHPGEPWIHRLDEDQGQRQEQTAGPNEKLSTPGVPRTPCFRHVSNRQRDDPSNSDRANRGNGIQHAHLAREVTDLAAGQALGLMYADDAPDEIADDASE
jgi:hypothetical protein